MNDNIRLNELGTHTYRTNFNEWYINPDCDIEISNDGLKATIKKFNPTKWCMRSNESTKTNTYISGKYSNWKLNITNLASIYNSSNNIDLLKFHPTGDTRNTYNVHGVMVCPIMGNEEWFYRFPWDMGIPSGSWKDQNGGWSVCGYIYDGIKNRSPFTSFGDGWGSNSNCQIAIGIYKNITPSSDEYVFTDSLPTDASAVDISKKYVKYFINGSNPIYQATVADGVVSWTKIGDYKEIVDITDNPIVVTIIPQDENGIKLHNIELWQGYIDGIAVRLSKKTVSNCLKRYYNGYDSNGKMVIPNIYPTPQDTDKTIKYIIPNAWELSDLYNYTPLNLRMEIDSDNNVSYVNWINKYFQENLIDLYRIAYGGMAMPYLGGMCINNNESNPVRLFFTSTRLNEHYNYYILDNLCFSGGISNGSQNKCRINALELVFRESDTGNYRISVAQRAFQNFQGEYLNIKHIDKSGNVVYPGKTCGFGFYPIQLDATFEGARMPVIKREWLSYNTVSNISYAFEMNPNLTEIQCNEGEEIVFWPHNMSKGDRDIQWPYFYRYTYDDNNNIIAKKSECANYSMIQSFDRCPKLTRIEPILNVKYLPNESFIYWAFGSESSNVTHLRLKGINNFNWDFTNTTNLGMINLDANSIKYIFDNAEDVKNIKYNESNVDYNNVSDSYPNLYFDAINFRSSLSQNGLEINCPSEWQDKITDEMVRNINAKGWTVKINGITYTI